MIRSALALLLVALLVGRAVEIHCHEDTVAHTESCAVCRALQAPVATPERSLEFAPLAAPDLHDAHGESDVVAVESPILGAHLLRAPPLA